MPCSSREIPWRWPVRLMKAYLITTVTLFGLITLAHVARIAAEGSHLATDPVFVCLTSLAAGICVWGFALLRRTPRP